MDLNHLHLHVRDTVRSTDFYRQWFGLEPKVSHGEIVFLNGDAAFDLALAPDPEPKPMPDWFHLGFRLASADAVRALYQRMQGERVAMTKEIQAWDDFVTYTCADPDGYRIEVYWE